MTGCLACTFGGEIPRVPGAAIKNNCLIVCRILSLQFQLFTASKTNTICSLKPSFWRCATGTDLHQWPGFALHCKPEVAKLTVAGV